MSENVEAEHVKGKYVRVDELQRLRRRAGMSVDRWTTHRDLPSGRLCLRAMSLYSGAAWEKQWRETKPRDLARRAVSIVRELENGAVEIAELVKEAERRAEIGRKEWEIEQQEQAVREAERRRVQSIKDSREELLGIVESWSVAMQIEQFFEDAGRRIADQPAEERLILELRFQRGRQLLGGVDALERLRSWRIPEER